MEYKYKGIELTPSIFAELLIQLYDGKQFSRQEAIDSITRYHRDSGGRLDKSSYTSVFKKATQVLKESGINNAGYGIWRLAYKEKDAIITIPEPKDKEEAYYAEKELGTGNKAVYLYYYNCYKELASLKGTSIWECKIGRTDVDPISRIFSQAGTCYPELPRLALIIHCDDSSLLEKALHSILKLQKKWLPSSPGKEWFMTSPDEVEQIYYTIVK